MKQPVVDLELCIGCGLCAELCPEVFELREDLKVYVIGGDKCGTCDCEEAVTTCPSEALSFSE